MNEEFADFATLDVSEDNSLWEIQGEVVFVPRLPDNHNGLFKWASFVRVSSRDGFDYGVAQISPLNLNSGKTKLMARATLNRHIPERLEFENGEDFALVAATIQEHDRTVIIDLNLKRVAPKAVGVIPCIDTLLPTLE